MVLFCRLDEWIVNAMNSEFWISGQLSTLLPQTSDRKSFAFSIVLVLKLDARQKEPVMMQSRKPGSGQLSRLVQ